MSGPIARLLVLSALVGSSLIVSACGGGGGGGGGGFDKSGELLSIEFPDPNNVTGAAATPGVPPVTAPLNQQVVFAFSGNPDPNTVTAQAIRVRTAAGGTAAVGQPVAGSFQVSGNRVIFTPALPMAEASAQSNGGAGLVGGGFYDIVIGPGTWSFVNGVSKTLLTAFPNAASPGNVRVPFGTTTVVSNFFKGLEKIRPRLVETDPADGSINVSPQLYTDPDGLFPPRAPFRLYYDAPINPHSLNLAGFQLIDMEDRPTGFSEGLPLGLNVNLVSNEVDGAIVELTPSGILPFGHLLSLEYPSNLRGIADEDDPGSRRSVAATFTVASVSDQRTVRDTLFENFDSSEREADPTELAASQSPASWDELDSNVLQPRFEFAGTGELGPFRPVPPSDLSVPEIVILDTSSQPMPLFDGSTPEAPPNTVVRGGVFEFSEIDIPEGVIVQARGPNPLILSATGNVRIAGDIILNGQRGNDENTFDSSLTANPGGIGGVGAGRGGEGQPTIYLGQEGNSPLVSPTRGGRGWGPGNEEAIGGEGGQSGMLDHPDENGEYTTDYELDSGSDNVRHGIGGPPSNPCQELTHFHNNGYKPPGGGGGSHRQEGRQPNDGIGNVLADGLGNYIVRTEQADPIGWKTLSGGRPGEWKFNDGNPDNNFIGARGERREIFGGQGGGAGGSALDSYYCGMWCMTDLNPANDQVCVNEQSYSIIEFDSEGDARGGSGGGGGGALLVRALGSITIVGSDNNSGDGATIQAQGGEGGVGEAVGCGNWAGGGGGGSGGALLFQSATGILVEDGATVRVSGGLGARATDETSSNSGNLFEALSFNEDGTELFAVTADRPRAVPPERLHTLDLNNALWTRRNPLVNDRLGDGLAFRPVDGFFYYASGPLPRSSSDEPQLFFQRINTEVAVDDPEAIVDIEVTDATILDSYVRAITYSAKEDAFYWAQKNRTLLLVSPQGTLIRNIGLMDAESGGLVAVPDGQGGERLYSMAFDANDVPQRKVWQEIDPTDASLLFDEKISVVGSSRNVAGGHGLALHPKTGDIWGLIDIGAQGSGEPSGYELVRMEPDTAIANPIGSTYRYFNTGTACRGLTRSKIGSGGRGGDGLIQFQVPGGSTANVETPDDLTSNAWVDQDNTMNPVEFGRESVALSDWYDMGRVIKRSPRGTNPIYRFRGLDGDGFVRVLADGQVANPDKTDIRIDFLGNPDPNNPGQFLPGQTPRANFLPTNASVKVEFQGAKAIEEGSKEIDPAQMTEFTAKISDLSSYQFIRYRITLNIQTDENESPTPSTPFPTVQSIAIHAEF